MAASYLRLDDVLLAPPLPAVLSLLMACGVADLGWRLARRLRGDGATALDVAAGFIAAATALAVVVHALALAQASSIHVLRPLGWALAALGAWALARHRARLVAAARDARASLREASRAERAGAIVVGTITLALAAAALGPVTDVDSIHYHLAVPLDWLRHGGAYPRPDWFHSRLVGIAEAENLLGLGAGTDGFGAALQLGGYVAAAVAVSAFATTRADRIAAWLVVASCPVVVFLVPNQKPQMLPSAATTVALVLVVRHLETFDLVDALLAFTGVAFALGSKVSFLLSADVVVALALWAAYRRGRLAAVLGVAAAVAGVVWVPLLARSFVFFGDPISPFLERLRPHPDLGLVGFANYLRAFGGERTFANLAELPLALLGTIHPGAFTGVLGLGALAFVPALRTRGPARVLLLAALAATIGCLLFGQISPRFFFEPYLWAGSALAPAAWGRAKRLVVGAIFAQAGLTLVVALLGAALLFPGALTRGARDAVLARSAAGYPENRWLDGLLPRDAVIVTMHGRFQLFSPRAFAVADPAVDDFGDADDGSHLARLVSQFGVTHLVLDYEDNTLPPNSFVRLARRCGVALAPPHDFAVAGRNPLNRLRYSSVVYSIAGCSAAGGR